MAHVPQYLRADEEARIHRQFQGDTWRRNNQVLWTGIFRDEAQRWADEHEMQTLTTAMGPLMDVSHPLCLRNKKSPKAWSKYVKGASAIFAWYISKGESVTVLSPPPPERFHPSGQTNYQVIEEPIVKGVLGTSGVSRIEMVHPTVEGAEDIYYQIWPVDDTTTWTARVGELNVQKPCWRKVKTQKAFSNQLGEMEIAKVHQEAKEKEKGEKKVSQAKATEKTKKEKKEEKKVSQATEKTKKEKKEEKKVSQAKAKATEKEKREKKEEKKVSQATEKTKKEKKEEKKVSQAKAKEKTKKEKKKEKKVSQAKAKKVEEKEKKEKKGKKRVKKTKKEKKKAKKKARKLEKEEKVNYQGRLEPIS
ncbi:hypothetical protein BP5796_08514 [Coleophoma crateriformis]|uniref:Uncharacterized protein n=1 Tax=Coleophoma crateriformis TaxID=565419 RepID=A0A3D8R7V0_9HELO|nr:hypothetical protein BP5796_08514 [Coleophoma crateriformis]